MNKYTVKAENVKPDDCMIIAGISVRVRYCYYHRSSIEHIKGNVTFDLQRFEDELHPLCDKTFMRISMGSDELVEVLRDE
ncbi:hypothetical protein NFC79_05985 [Providencia stuartii]|nr:hypothetical protein NFC79_05985 [Providencia stuartii]